MSQIDTRAETDKPHAGCTCDEHTPIADRCNPNVLRCDGAKTREWIRISETHPHLVKVVWI
jgi:hypothetical protein